MTKSFHELYTEIAHYVEPLQWVMVEAHEQGCSLLLLVDASTNPAVPMPAVRIVHEDQAVWCGAWHQALTATPASAWAAAATRRAKGGDVTSPERNK